MDVVRTNSFDMFQQQRLAGGLEKIDEAQIELKELDARLQVQRKEVLKRSEECQKLLSEIAEKTASAREMEGEAIEKKKSLDVKQAEIAVKKVWKLFFMLNVNEYLVSIG